MTPQQLKNSILQLAIQGKLVEQRSEEGTGQDLFNQIQEEKQKLIAEGKIKKEKALAPITEDEIPFDIPESWRWCRLVSLFQFINGDRGKNYPSKDKLKTKGIPFISAINLKDGKILHDEKLMCLSNEQYDLLSSGKLQKNDIVICIRGSLGKHAVFTEEQGAIASSLVILRQPKKLNSMVSYVSYFIDSKLFFDEISQTDNGTAQPNLSSKNLENFIFPLPPLAEQKRIVAKIEELLSYVDKYQEYYDELESLKSKFPGQLRKSILQYAIEGKLVEQRPEEGTGQELFNQIQEEKQNLITQGKIKKEKALASISDEEIPFDIPNTWKWCRLAELGECITGATPSKSNPHFYGGNIPFIGPGEIVNESICLSEKFLSAEGVKHARLVKQNSVLQVCIGGSIGKAAINKVDLTCNQQINVITPFIVSEKYVFYSITSPYFLKLIKENSTGTATPIINKQTWGNIFIPIPPLEEQKRIVAKVEELFALCDKLDLS